MGLPFIQPYLKNSLITSIIIILLITVPLSANESDSNSKSIAQPLLKILGKQGGLCVQLGVKNGDYPIDLHLTGKFLVNAIATDKKSLEASRLNIRNKGLYGNVSIQSINGKELPYAENIVNVIVAHDLTSITSKGISLKEILRVLTPEGLLAYKGSTPIAELKAAGFNFSQTTSPWIIVSKPKHLNVDEWTHVLHGPDGNPVSQDMVVAPPSRVKWVDGPNWGKHGSGLGGWVSAAGKIFYVYDSVRFSFPGARMLVARDAHNGLILWKRLIESSYVKQDQLKFIRYNKFHLIAIKNRVYTVLKNRGPLVALDSSTGKIIHTYENVKNINEIIYDKGKLIVTAGGINLIDAKTGKIIWKAKAGGSIVLAKDRVISEYYAGKGRHNLTCVDLKTGKQLWQNIGEPRNFVHPIYYKEIVIISDYKTINGYSIKNGKKLWSFEARQAKRGSVFPTIKCAQGLVWSHVYFGPKGHGAKTAWIGLEPLTGIVKKKFIDKDPAASILERHACCPDHSTERYFIYGKCSFVDTTTGETIRYKGTRTTCNSGFFPANGMLYFSPFACACGNFMRGFRAMSPPAKITVANVPDNQRFTFGPAKGTKAGTLNVKTDWPTYRGNLRRTAYVEHSLTSKMSKQWESKSRIGKKLSAPVIAGNSIYLSDKDSHQVLAIDASDGNIRWRFTTEGRVDSPPSVSGNHVVFGCVDGYIYCLRASDGLLIWRFLAAPRERRIVSHGQLESVWPVHGSLPIINGIVYAAAGRHTLADGGIYAYALNIQAGTIKWKKRLANFKYKAKRDSVNMICYLMSFDGQKINLGKQGLDLETGKLQKGRQVKGLVCGGMSGMLVSDWFNYNNTKSKQRWFDGRSFGKILASGPEITYGMATDSGRRGAAQPGSKNFKLFASKGGRKNIWKFSVPIQVRAMALTDKTLYIAGRKDSDLSEVNKLGRFQRYKVLSELPEEKINPHSGIFATYATIDGKKQMEIEIQAPPVFDGLAIAGQKVYIVCLDGKMRCFAK